MPRELLEYRTTVPCEECAVTRTGPKRHSDVTHELRDTTYRAEGLAARLRLSGISGERFWDSARTHSKAEHQQPFPGLKDEIENKEK